MRNIFSTNMLFPDGNSAVRLESRGNPGMEVSQSWTSSIWGNLGANTSDGQAVVTHTTRMTTQNSHSHGGGQPLYLDQHLPLSISAPAVYFRGYRCILVIIRISPRKYQGRWGDVIICQTLAFRLPQVRSEPCHDKPFGPQQS